MGALTLTLLDKGSSILLLPTIAELTDYSLTHITNNLEGVTRYPRIINSSKMPLCLEEKINTNFILNCDPFLEV